jgi:hypothetical protein
MGRPRRDEHRDGATSPARTIGGRDAAVGRCRFDEHLKRRDERDREAKPTAPGSGLPVAGRARRAPSRTRMVTIGTSAATACRAETASAAARAEANGCEYATIGSWATISSWKRRAAPSSPPRQPAVSPNRTT